MPSRRCPAILAFLGAAIAAVKAQKPITDCDNIVYNGGYAPWLSADCTADDGTTLSSAVYLPNQITNDDGYLKWKVSGNYACDDCSIDAKATLSCTCQSNASGRRNTTLDLTEHISVYSGILLSDFLHDPVPPTNPSTSPVPTDPSYTFKFGQQGCHFDNSTGATPPQGLGCDKAPVADPSGCSEYATLLSDGAPESCSNFREPTSQPIYLTFQGINVEAQGGAPWEVSVYPSLDCSGEPLKVLGSDLQGSCEALEVAALSWSVKPTWNADY